MSGAPAEAKKRPEPGMLQLVLVLLIISAVVALLLGVVNYVTAPAIAANEKAKNEAAMAAVLPADSYTPVDYSGGDTPLEAVYQAGDAGYVFQVSPSGSFSGTLTIMVGVSGEGQVTGVEIVKTAETSGLGANAGKPAFREQFVGASGSVSVSKDGGAIDALTGATITSRAVCAGVNSALDAAASLG